MPTVPDGCLLGCHITTAGGIEKAPERATRINCTTAQVFLSSNRQWKIPDLEEGQAETYRGESKRVPGPIVAHAKYLINLAKKDPEAWEQSVDTLRRELMRCETLAIPYLVIHPGSHVGNGEQYGMDRIREALDRIHRETGEIDARILIETMAGQGSVLPYRFEQMERIRDQLEHPERVGYCLDTCHVHAAGYDISTEDGYGSMMDQVESVLGLDRVKVLHLNDSRAEAGDRKDRHEDIGRGTIGPVGFKCLMNDPRWEDVPKILETPWEDDWETEYARNMDTLLEYLGS